MALRFWFLSGGMVERESDRGNAAFGGVQFNGLACRCLSFLS